MYGHKADWAILVVDAPGHAGKPIQVRDLLRGGRGGGGREIGLTHRPPIVIARSLSGGGEMGMCQDGGRFFLF